MFQRSLLLAVTIAAILIVSGCVGLMYGGPGYTRSVPVAVPLNENTYEILKNYDRSIELVLDNDDVVELSYTFVFGSDVCGHVGCIPAARIKSIIITDERFDAENAIFETAARVQAVTLWTAASPFLSDNSPGSLLERMRAEPDAFLEKTAQDANRYESSYAHPICGSAKHTPAVVNAAKFYGTRDEQAAQWLWENRYSVPSICFRRTTLLQKYYLTPEQQIELLHVKYIRQYWRLASCKRALFHAEVAHGFSVVTETHPAWAIITARLRGMAPEEAWERFNSLLSRNEWIDGSNEDLERACKDAGGIAAPKALAARLADLRKIPLSFDAGGIAFIGDERVQLNDRCRGLEPEDRGNCYLHIFTQK